MDRRRFLTAACTIVASVALGLVPLPGNESRPDGESGSLGPVFSATGIPLKPFDPSQLRAPHRWVG